MRQTKKQPLLFIALSVILVLSAGMGIAFGSQDIRFVDAYHVLWYKFSFGIGSVPDQTIERIAWGIRAPRVLLAIFVGGGLSIIGVSMQALVRNPLAEPYILGISGGASAGASLFYLGFVPPVLSKTLSLPFSAFLGGLCSITLVYLVARRGKTLPVTRLLLAGVAMSALMGAVTSFITFASPDPDKLRAILFWLLGSLSGTRWETLPIPAAISLFGMGVLVVLSRALDAFLIGEEPAFNLGVPTETIKRLLIILAALVTGSLVAVSGAIGFVGLIIPHSVRLVAGVSHRYLLPLSFLAGGIFLMWADLAARTLFPPLELPVGVLTALCGVPFFLILLRRSHYQFG